MRVRKAVRLAGEVHVMLGAVLRVVGLGAFLLRVNSFCATATRRCGTIDSGMMRALDEARIDHTSEEQLIAALRNSNENVAFSAAYGLAELPKTTASERALEEAFETRSENVAYWAAVSLASFGNKKWVPLAAQRLRGGQDEHVQVAMASLLAKGGNLEGWFVVENQLRTKYPLDALVAVPSFVKMNRDSVDLVRLLEGMLIGAEGESRDVIDVIERSLAETRRLLAVSTKR